MSVQEKILGLMRTHVSLKKIPIKKFDINYACAGSGPPLLLIHGANMGWGQWYPNIDELAEKFTVYAIDLPGSGESTKIDFTAASFEDDYVSTVEEFIKSKNLQEAHVIGHSMGGWIALRLALRGAIRGKIILESSLGFSDYISWSFRPLCFYPLAQLLAKTVMRPTRANMSTFLGSVLSEKNILKDEFIDYFHQSVVRERITHPFLFIHQLSDGVRLKKELVLMEEVSQIKNPILIIAGDKDPLIPLAHILAGLSAFHNAELKVFSNTGHVPSLERAQEFNAHAREFLLNPI